MSIEHMDCKRSRLLTDYEPAEPLLLGGTAWKKDTVAFDVWQIIMIKWSSPGLHEESTGFIMTAKC